ATSARADTGGQRKTISNSTVGYKKITFIKKHYKILLNYILGPLLFIILSYAIYAKVNDQPNLPQKLELLRKSFSKQHAWYIVVLFLLMFLNWSIEARKWQLLVKPVQKVSFFIAAKAVLSGLSLSLFLPNGIGEYAGRIVYMNQGNRLRSVALTIAGSMSQLIITLVAGLGGFIYLRSHTWHNTGQLQGLSFFWINGIISMIFIGTLLLLFVYFKLSWLTSIVEKIPFVDKYKYLIENLETFHWRELTRILFLSCLRFIVFVIQYVLILHFFKVDIGFADAVCTTCVLFLVLAILPTIPLADVGIRSQAGIQLFGLLTTNSLGILATTAGIWFINLIVPSVAGSLFILGIKIFKKQET
ncbi:MAG: lysylphosphatidylglycerol synthase domain-containing protein, partial [Parafilimonas sp.]